MKNTYRYKGYYVYFTSKCLIEAFHVHSGKYKKRSGSAKFFIRANGDTVIASKGRLSDKTVAEIQDYIKSNYRDIYKDWLASGGTPGFYNK